MAKPVQISELSQIRAANLKAILDDTADSLTAMAKCWGMSSQSLRNIYNMSSNFSEKMAGKVTAGAGIEPGWLDVDRRDNPETPFKRVSVEQSFPVTINEDTVNVRIWSDSGDMDIGTKAPKSKAVKFVMDLMNVKYRKDNAG